MKWMVREGPLSPSTHIPWSLVVAVTLWFLQMILLSVADADLGPPGARLNDGAVVALAWAIAAVAVTFYIYKNIENISVAYFPGSWWTNTQDERQHRRPHLRNIDATDVIDVVTPFFFVGGVLGAALFEGDVSSFPQLPPTDSAPVRLLRLSATINLSSVSVGFSSIVPTGVLAEVLVSLLASLFILSTAIIVGALVGALSAATVDAYTSRDDILGMSDKPANKTA